MASGLTVQSTVTVASAGTKVALLASNPSPQKLYSVVAVEADKDNTGLIFVGDLNVSSTRYAAKLSPGQRHEFSGQVIDPSRIFVDSDVSGSKAQWSTVRA